MAGLNFGAQDHAKENQENRMSKRLLLISSKILCAGIVILAYQQPENYYFSTRMALYNLMMCLLTTYYSWADRVSRIIMISLSALCANNLYDELFGNPLVFGWNEFFFGVLIFINLIYQTYRLWKMRLIK
jgi:hypothetical protein